ncbi:MAG: hypothetical protein DRI57_27260 [Deltaproteobacteria bacterium]|nr:MAG: hypothetical protein DRI57_27260 [Deltaproteobacteria bacterium]
MNEDHRNDIIKYRIERSEETYRGAILMSRENHWNACANRRLCSSCFYAVTALILTPKGSHMSAGGQPGYELKRFSFPERDTYRRLPQIRYNQL